MARQVSMLSPCPDDLSSVSRSHMGKEEANSPKLSYGEKAKSTGWSSKGPRFYSWNPQSIFPASVTAVARNPASSSGLHSYQAHVWYTETQADSYTSAYSYTQN